MTAERCADLSVAAGESLAATATTAHNWLLVEVRANWSRDVGETGSLEGPVHAAIDQWIERTPYSRLLFIRRPGRARERRLVFVVRSTECEAEVRRIGLDSMDALAGVDLAVDGERVDSPLVLVCGHGARDACCALRGSAVYGALGAHIAPDDLWISSHQGGHRFAANVLVLPAGIQLGRVSPQGAPAIVGDALVGHVPLEQYRGRTPYSRREQAAEHAVREAKGLVSLSDLRLAGDDGRHVRFVDSASREHTCLVEETSGPTLPASCGAAAEPQAHFSAQLVSARPTPSADASGR